MAVTLTTNHGLKKQAKKDTNWHTSLNETLDIVDTRLPRGYDGNPNGNVAGAYLGQPVYDYTNKIQYVCTLVGNATTAEWEPAGGAGLTKEIKMWWGTIAEIPLGYQLCDGTNGVPDLRDRFIVGASADDGGVAKSNITGALLQSGGSNSATVGAAGGHTPTGTVGDTTLTINQIPSHTHGAGTLATDAAGAHSHFVANSSVGTSGGSAISNNSTATGGQINTNSAGNHSHTISGSTASAGTGGSHTHTFTGDSVEDHTHTVTVVPKFYAMAFITRIPADV